MENSSACNERERDKFNKKRREIINNEEVKKLIGIIIMGDSKQ